MKKVLCAYGSRADRGGIEAVYHALLKRNIDSTFGEINKFGEGFDVNGKLTDVEEFDLVVLLGDRYEVLYFALYTYRKKKPIAHLSGGDITTGSQDDCMRHAITKLSHLHFPTNNYSARVIRQLGEEPWRIHVVGYPGADHMVTHGKEVSTKLVGDSDYMLVVWHPNTLVPTRDAIAEASVITSAIDKFPFKKLILSPNFDDGGLEIANYFEVWAAGTNNRYIGTLPRDMFLTVMKYAKVMVGNSSAGFYEAPTFGTPVVNIGNRQLGRIVPPNMTWAGVEVDDIVEAINTAMEIERVVGRRVDNVYQRGNAADKIAEVISNIKDVPKLLQKGFNYSSDHWTS